MPIVLAAGPSITDYPKTELWFLAKHSFTFAVNQVAFDFPCDVIVSLDFDALWNDREKYRKIGVPIITRELPGNKKLGLDLIELPNAIILKMKYSGMVACKLSDCIALAQVEARAGDKSYVLGMDASANRYKGHSNVEPWVYDGAGPQDYENMNLQRTINLSVHSRISCWPKMSKLPKIYKTGTNAAYRVIAIAWLRANARNEVYAGVK